MFEEKLRRCNETEEQRTARRAAHRARMARSRKEKAEELQRKCDIETRNAQQWTNPGHPQTLTLANELYKTVCSLQRRYGVNCV